MPQCNSALEAARRKTEALLGIVQPLLYEREHLLLQIDEGQHTIDQLRAQLKSLQAETKRSHFSPHRAAWSLALLANLLTLASFGFHGLDLTERDSQDVSIHIESSINFCNEISIELQSLTDGQDQ